MKEYFRFTRTDRIGLLALVFLILFILFLPAIFPRKTRISLVLTDSAIMTASGVDQPQKLTNTFSLEEIKTDPSVSLHAELFSFDPNTLDAPGWKRLGLDDKVTRTLLNYRNKGGHFYKKEDLKKIWGLPGTFYDRVEAFIRLDHEVQNRAPFPSERSARKIALIEINSADTSAFIALPGIASILANRIIKFRDKLGGFYSVDQIAETYGLRDSTFQLIKPYLRVKEDGVRKIKINQASKDELGAHPYIRWKAANAILDYRIRHGAFTSLEELKNIPQIEAAALEKLIHYLSL